MIKQGKIGECKYYYISSMNESNLLNERKLTEFMEGNDEGFAAFPNRIKRAVHHDEIFNHGQLNNINDISQHYIKCSARESDENFGNSNIHVTRYYRHERPYNVKKIAHLETNFKNIGKETISKTDDKDNNRSEKFNFMNSTRSSDILFNPKSTKAQNLNKSLDSDIHDDQSKMNSMKYKIKPIKRYHIQSLDIEDELFSVSRTEINRCILGNASKNFRNIQKDEYRNAVQDENGENFSINSKRGDNIKCITSSKLKDNDEEISFAEKNLSDNLQLRGHYSSCRRKVSSSKRPFPVKTEKSEKKTEENDDDILDLNLETYLSQTSIVGKYDGYTSPEVLHDPIASYCANKNLKIASPIAFFINCPRCQKEILVDQSKRPLFKAWRRFQKCITSHRDPENERTFGHIFCKIHRAYKSLIPEGLKNGYPADIDFNSVKQRVKALIPSVFEVVLSSKQGVFLALAQRRYYELGRQRAQAINYHKFSHAREIQCGYYGYRTNSMISNIIRTHPLGRELMKSAPMEPFSSVLEIIQDVLVPEIGWRLIQQDQQFCSPKEAIRIMKESREYGNVLNGDSDNEDQEYVHNILL